MTQVAGLVSQGEAWLELIGKEFSCNKRKMRQSSSLKNWVDRTAGGADSNLVDMQTLQGSNSLSELGFVTYSRSHETGIVEAAAPMGKS